MKKLSFLFAALIVLIFTSCQENSGLETSDINDLIGESGVNSSNAMYGATAETAVSVSMEDVDLIIHEGIDQYFKKIKPKGRFGRLECAEVTVDTVAKTMSIDFGDGCEDKRGILRSGKITIERSGKKNEPGAYHKVTFEAFTVDSVQIDGVRTSTNITDPASDDSVEVFQTVLSGGKLTFNDSISITRESELIRTRYRGDSTNEGYTTITGSATGLMADGTAYTSTILEEILMTRSCDLRVPVAGVKDLVFGGNTIELNYGDGTCDNLAELTINGESSTIELDIKAVCEGKGKQGKEDREDHKKGKDNQNKHGNGNKGNGG